MKTLKAIVVLGYNGVGKTDFCNKFVEKYPEFKFYNQPEMGLHPVLHFDLANNIIGENEHSIIETHSENITLRFRKLIVQEILKPEEVLFLWLDKDIENDMTIVADKEGTLSDFPEGVFNENLKEILEIDREINKRLNLITIDNKGTLSDWPEGVFTEDTAEFIEMRKIVRKQKQQK